MTRGSRRALVLLAIATLASTASLLVPDRADADYVGPSSEPKFADLQVSLNANGCQTVITGQAGKRFRVWSFVLNSRENANGVAGVLGFRNATSQNSVMVGVRLQQQATITNGPAGSMPVFQTTATGEGLQVCNTGAATVAATVLLTYTEFDPAATTRYNESHVTNTSSDRVPVDLDASDVGGGSGGGEVTLVGFGDDESDYPGLMVPVALGLGVFLLGAVVVMRFRS